MKAKENPIYLALDSSLRGAGFTKKANCWYRNNPDVLEVMHLQRSQFGPQYYINYALWLKALGEPEPLPKEHQCHIRMREDDIIEGDKRIRSLLDLESDIAPEDRQREIMDFISNSFTTLSDQCRTLDGMRRLFIEGRFSGVLILATARRVLSGHQ